MARTDWQYVNGSTNNNSVFMAGIRWRYRDDLFGTTGYPTDRTSSNTDIIEYQPFSGRKQSYNTFSYTNWRTSYYRYSYNTISGQDPDTASNTLNISTTFRFDKATNNTKYYPVKGSLSASNVFNISSDDTSRIIQVPHCSDGTSKVRLFFHYTGDSNTAFSYGETNAVITLETIPRASLITVNDANIGSSTNIVINKASSSFTTTLSYKASGENNWTTIVTKTPNQVYGWVVPTSFYSLIPNSKTISCEIKADTYSDDTLIGTKTATATFTATGNPVINSSSATDVNSTTTALTGNSANMVKYASNVQVSVSVSGQNSASVSSVTINGSNVSLSGTNPKTGNITFNGATTNSFEIKVTDSRGYQTTTTHTMTMVNYVPLTINATIKRNQPTDGKVNINASGNYFNASFGSQSNTLSVQYRYKESTSSDFGNWINLSVTTSGNTYSGSTQLSNMDYTKSYNFEIRATDKVGTKSITGITVTKGTPVYWWDNDEFHVNGTMNVNGTFWTSHSGTENTTDTWTPVWNNGKLEHRVIPTTYNTTSPILSKVKADTFQNTKIAGGTFETSGVYIKLCNITYSSHSQGSFVGMRIYIGDGNNGNPEQNAFIDLLMQLGWTGSNDGRFGCMWELHPMTTGFTLSNVNIIVIANSNINYDIYLWTSKTYVVPNYVVNCGDLVTVSHVGSTSTFAPAGTQCNISGLIVPSYTTTGTGVVTRSDGATLDSSTWRRFGNVVQLTIVIKTTSSTSTGSNAFTGTINNSALIPKIPINSSSYNGSTGLNCYIDENGNITCRVIASTLSSGANMTIGFTYVV